MQAKPRSVPSPESARGGYAPAIPAIGVVLLLTFALLYQYDYDRYLRVLDYLIDGVWRFPFLDWIYVPAQIQCWQQGVDVYAATPCDPLNRPMDYSPLWLRLSFIPTGKEAVAWSGLGLDLSFIASTGFLPGSRRGVEFVVVALATYSSATILALERANVDALMFVLAVVATLCLERTLAVRVVGFCAILLAGLLKFYPLAMLTMLLRERLTVCAALGLAATALLTSLAFVYLDELVRILPNVPRWSYFEPNVWGAARLPGGIGQALQAFTQAAGFGSEWFDEVGSTKTFERVAGLALVLGLLASSLRLARARTIFSALDALPNRSANFLVLSAALTCGCFFAGQSARYRAIVMLLSLPGLLALARDGQPSINRLVFSSAVIAVLLVVWQPLLLHIGGDTLGYSLRPVTHGPATGYAFWLIQELACWSIAAVLTLVLFWFVLRSPIAPSRFARRKSPP
jgi:hypothetical protein